MEQPAFVYDAIRACEYERIEIQNREHDKQMRRHEQDLRKIKQGAKA